MPRGQKDKLYRNFSKGLITEAGFLTYPEDSSTDELNTIIYRKGNRSRRLGMDFEPGSDGFAAENFTSASTVNEYFWRSPGNKSSLNLIAVQIDTHIFFFDASVTPLEDGNKDFAVDLTELKAPAATVDQVRTSPVSMAGGKGYLFVAGEFIDPFIVNYDPVTDTAGVTRIHVMIRDFDGVNDGLPNDAEPGFLSNEHLYNLRNQGWVPPGSSSVQGSLPGAEPATGGTDGAGTGDGVGGSSGTYYDPYNGSVTDEQRWLEERDSR